MQKIQSENLKIVDNGKGGTKFLNPKMWITNVNKLPMLKTASEEDLLYSQGLQ